MSRLVLPRVLIPMLLALCSSSSSSFPFSSTMIHAQTMADLLSSPGWMVESGASPAYVCSLTTCCCFTSVNIYPQGNTLYINGSVAGQTCDANVKGDNINPPNSFNFTQEFFGMDGVNFNLANATYQNKSGWSLTATAPSNCGFTLFRESAIPLPITPTPAPITPAVLPDYAATYLGTWDFDSDTCQVNNASCCCFTGPTTISRSPSGVAWYYITGPPSPGCMAASPYQDDFPWPTTGTTLLSTVAARFLKPQDSYQITYNMMGDSASLLFVDLTSPVCSMRASRSFRVPDSSSSGLSGGAVAGIIFAVLIGVGVLACIGRRVYATYGTDSIGSAGGPSSRLMPHGRNGSTEM